MSKIDTITVGETTYDVGGAGNIAYGTCSTEAATAQKEVVLTSGTYFKLETGAIVAVKFDNTNTAENPTLKVGTTEAKSIWYNTSVITTSNLNRAGYANRYLSYMYDGTNWVWIGQSTEENTTYTPPKLGSGYGTCATEESTTAKTATLSNYELVTGGIVSVKFTNAVPASSTLSINSKTAKAIYYKGSAITDGIIKAGDVATFVYSGQYHLLAIDRAVDIDSVYSASETLIRDTVGWTGKNLNSVPYCDDNSVEVRGVTFTINSDGSVTANGSNTGEGASQFFCHARYGYKDNKNPLILPNGKYILSGCPSGGGSSTYNMQCNSTKNGASRTYGTDTGNGVEVTLNGDDRSQTEVQIGVFINIAKDQTVNNLTFYPMIRHADIADPTYEPYHESVEQSKFDRAEQAVLGAKNLIPYPYYSSNSSTSHGVTFTVDQNGIVYANGTNDGIETSDFYMVRDSLDKSIISGGILTGCPSGGSDNTYQLLYRVGDSTSHNYKRSYRDYGDGVIIPSLANNEDARIFIQIRKNATVSNLAFKPMLRLASDPDDTYVPYAMTNKELTDGKAEASAIAPVENGSTASKAYDIGHHFYRNGAFCTCISAIASGGSFTLNTNYKEGTVGADLDFFSNSGGYALQTGDDLNNATYFTKYRANTSDIAASLLHCPINKAFKMICDFRSTINITQIITTTNKDETPPAFYYRRRMSENSWTDWYKLTGTVVS